LENFYGFLNNGFHLFLFNFFIIFFLIMLKVSDILVPIRFSVLMIEFVLSVSAYKIVDMTVKIKNI